MSAQAARAAGTRRVLVWRGDNVRQAPSDAQLTRALQDQASLVWMDLQGDPHQFGDELSKRFGLSALTLDMIAERYERAKLAQGDGYYYLVVHGLTFDQQAIAGDLPELDIIFGRNFLITSHTASLGWLRDLWQAAQRDTVALKRGVAFLLHTILDGLVDSYFPVLDDIDDLVDTLENETVRGAVTDAVQGRIFRVKRVLAQMRRVISPQVEVFNSLLFRTDELIPAEARPYYADVHDHLVRAFEILDSYRDLMSGLLDVYLSTVSNRMNVIMKQLTIYAAIFFPITFITGVFGQNFAHMPQVEHDSGFNFWIVLGIMALLVAGHLVYFRWKRWI